MYSFTILQSMKCKESALCFRNVLFDSNIAKTPAESNFYFSIYPNQVDLIVKLFSQNQTEGGSRYDLKDLISTVKFHKQTVILSHSMCSSKQCDMHFLLQILEIRNFVVGGEMTDRILLLLRVLGVLSLCRSCWVRDLLLPEHNFCYPTQSLIFILIFILSNQRAKLTFSCRESIRTPVPLHLRPYSKTGRISFCSKTNWRIKLWSQNLEP